MNASQNLLNTPSFGWLKAAGIFLACLLASCLLPFVAVYGHYFLPRELPYHFFFFPQLAFPYDSVVVRDAAGSRAVFTPAAAALLSTIQWALLTVGFPRAARRLKVGYMFLLALLVIGIATHLVAFGVTFFGAAVEVDGP